MVQYYTHLMECLNYVNNVRFCIQKFLNNKEFLVVTLKTRQNSLMRMTFKRLAKSQRI